MIGIIGVCALLILLSVGVPIGVAMGLVGLVGMCVLLGIEPALIKSGVVLFESVSRFSCSWRISALPRVPAGISSLRLQAWLVTGVAALHWRPSRAARASAR
jgi:hypothetical protein